VTYDYLMTAVMEQHRRYCLHVDPANVLCTFNPPSTLRSEFDRLDSEAHERLVREREAAAQKAKEEAETAQRKATEEAAASKAQQDAAAQRTQTAAMLTGSTQLDGVTK
jgi:hypothetical protein